jgi:hypothetical protein
MNMENMGKKARDKVTGFEGIITAKVHYMYGCDQYGLTPKVLDGKIGDTNFFDEGRIEIIGDGIKPAAVAAEKPGGVQRDQPRGVR